jgi:hypothetical protein
MRDENDKLGSSAVRPTRKMASTLLVHEAAKLWLRWWGDGGDGLADLVIAWKEQMREKKKMRETKS